MSKYLRSHCCVLWIHPAFYPSTMPTINSSIYQTIQHSSILSTNRGLFNRKLTIYLLVHQLAAHCPSSKIPKHDFIQFFIQPSNQRFSHLSNHLSFQSSIKPSIHKAIHLSSHPSSVYFPCNRLSNINLTNQPSINLVMRVSRFLCF